jgi:hypothetical protein
MIEKRPHKLVNSTPKCLEVEEERLLNSEEIDDPLKHPLKHLQLILPKHRLDRHPIVNQRFMIEKRPHKLVNSTPKCLEVEEERLLNSEEIDESSREEMVAKESLPMLKTPMNLQIYEKTIGDAQSSAWRR